VSQQKLLRGLASGGVVVSRFTAHRLGLGVGSTLRLPTPEGLHSFRVAAVFEDVLSFDSLILDQSLYQRLWHDTSVDRYAVIPQPGQSLPRLAGQLRQVAQHAEMEADVLTRDEAVTKLFGVLTGTIALARVLQLVGLIVAALVVFNTMLTAVSERRWEFGLTRAIGMTPSGLSVRVGVESLGIGILGSLTALAVGLAMGAFMLQAMNSRFAWGVAYSPDWAASAGALVAGVLVAVLAGVYPSRIAGRSPIASELRLQ
jgi:putative ABC transport system permease protein